METAVEIEWISMLNYTHPFCLISVRLVLGSDSKVFTKQILLPECGFLKFIKH